jgi:hypothetical protein
MCPAAWLLLLLLCVTLGIHLRSWELSRLHEQKATYMLFKEAMGAHHFC